MGSAQSRSRDWNVRVWLGDGGFVNENCWKDLCVGNQRQVKSAFGPKVLCKIENMLFLSKNIASPSQLVYFHQRKDVFSTSQVYNL